MPSLAVSNIAWPADAHEAALNLLASLNVTAIEIAPLNLLPSWDCDLALVHDIRRDLDARGISCVALQGICAGVENTDLLFNPAPLKLHLSRVAEIAKILGARACVFGAPRLRNLRGLDYSMAFQFAVQFLREIASAFHDKGSTLTFEAISSRYGCNFVTGTLEAIDLVRLAASPGIGLQIDTGTMFCEGETTDVISSAFDSPAAAAFHVHISEPDLAPIGTQSCNHTSIAQSLRNYPGALSIEMRATPTWERDIRNSVNFVRNTYFS